MMGKCVQAIRCEERGFVQLLVRECQLSRSVRRLAAGLDELRLVKLLDSHFETRVSFLLLIFLSARYSISFRVISHFF